MSLPKIPIAILLFWSGVAVAEEGDGDLSLRLKVGESLSYKDRSVATRRERMPAGEEETASELERQSHYEIHVLEANERDYVIRQTLKSFSAKGEDHSLQVDYDSARGDAPPTLKTHPAYIKSKTVGVSYSLRISTSGTLIEIVDASRLLEIILSDLEPGHPGRQVISEQYLGGQLQIDYFAPVPQWACRPGAQWSSASAATAEFGMGLRIRSKLRFDSLQLTSGRPTLAVSRVDEPLLASLHQVEPLSMPASIAGQIRYSYVLDPLSGVSEKMTSEASLSFRVRTGTRGDGPDYCFAMTEKREVTLTERR